MNERIKQLAEQAGLVKILDEHASEYGNGMFENTPYPELEKFAELIVKECADVIAPMGDWCGGHGEPSMPSTMECAKRLKQHFGVEE